MTINEKEWREKNYPGATGITKRLLLYWQDPRADTQTKACKRLQFCQRFIFRIIFTIVGAIFGLLSLVVGFNVNGMRKNVQNRLHLYLIKILIGK